MQLFLATETDTDDYVSLAGSAGITDTSMINYLGAFEIILDSLISKHANDSSLPDMIFDEKQKNTLLNSPQRQLDQQKKKSKDNL